MTDKDKVKEIREIVERSQKQLENPPHFAIDENLFIWKIEKMQNMMAQIEQIVF